ncbi:MAG: rRNA maturation RNase YbeY [Actinomycetota bacterium]|jgi:probable rRNA maturation factor|nr:rRNA maturation RNase YbeY [Actinomycetota bacterium]
MIDIYAADEQGDVTVDLERWSELCRQALIEEGVRGLAEVSLIFTGEAAMGELNEQFMGKRGPTDVLSFPIDAEPEPTGRVPDAGGTGPGETPTADIPQLVGDIVICPAVAARNAIEHGCSFEDEVALLVVHGVLHLRGWDHVVDEEAERMEAREQELLSRHYRSNAT